MRNIKMIIVTLGAVLFLLLLPACSGGFTSNNRCFWDGFALGGFASFDGCDSRPTKQFVTANDTVRYYCRACSSICHRCGARARRSHTCGMDFIRFRCNDC